MIYLKETCIAFNRETEEYYLPFLLSFFLCNSASKSIVHFVEYHILSWHHIISFVILVLGKRQITSQYNFQTLFMVLCATYIIYITAYQYDDCLYYKLIKSLSINSYWYYMKYVIK